MKIVGILNVTPDSFSDGGDFFSADVAVAHAQELVSQGADIIDVGGESTRPNAEPVSVAEELRRVIPVIEALTSLNIITSIDSTKADVVQAGLNVGATIVNDVSACRLDARLVTVVAESPSPYVLMHMYGDPKTMQQTYSYDDVVDDLLDFFEKRIAWLCERGIARNRIIVDPGIGFGKSAEHNWQILREIDRFRIFELPLYVGASRKRFLGDLVDKPAPERDAATGGTVAWCIARDVDYVRVHDVAGASDIKKVWDKLLR